MITRSVISCFYDGTFQLSALEILSLMVAGTGMTLVWFAETRGEEAWKKQRTEVIYQTVTCVVGTIVFASNQWGLTGSIWLLVSLNSAFSIVLDAAVPSVVPEGHEVEERLFSSDLPDLHARQRRRPRLETRRRGGDPHRSGVLALDRGDRGELGLEHGARLREERAR
jgi:hypothetical protein